MHSFETSAKNVSNVCTREPLLLSVAGPIVSPYVDIWMFISEAVFFPADFLIDVRSLRKRYDSSIPVLVHCSAGVGRSGVVLIVDLLMAKVDCGEVSKELHIVV